MDLKPLFDAFYNRLLLRDFFGKVVPGALVLLSIVGHTETPTDLSIWGWLLILGASWIAGFAAQAIGEWTGLVRYYPKVLNAKPWREVRKDLLSLSLPDKNTGASRDKGDVHWLEFILEFDKHATEGQKLLRERLVVIKEACGNAAAALLVSVVVLVLTALGSGGFPELGRWASNEWPTLTVATVGFIVLHWMHRTHVRRQFRMMALALQDLA